MKIVMILTLNTLENKGKFTMKKMLKN